MVKRLTILKSILTQNEHDQPQVINMEKPIEMNLDYSKSELEETGKIERVNQAMFTNMSLKQKIKHIKDNITVEPVVACYIMPWVLSSLAVQNLNLEKACRVNLQYSDEVCYALSVRDTANYTFEEEEVQKLTAWVLSWKNVMATALPCILILFLGAWSDKTKKRKICILMPIVGEILYNIALILNTYFFYELPVEVTAFMDIFPAMTGGWTAMSLGVFSYIGDITSVDTRTFRVGLLNLCMSLGIPIGMALSGVLFRLIGYYGMFSLTLVLHVISFSYGYITIQEPNKASNKEDPKSMKDLVGSFFDLAHVKETLTVAFKNGPNNRKKRITLLIIAVCVVFGPIYGEMSVMYLFTRYRFNWNELDFSIFSTYSIVTNLIGTLFSISIFSDHLMLDDSIIGIISSTSKILSSFIYAFATTTWEIYMAPLVEIFNGTSYIAMRSIASKLVSNEELGKINSLLGLAEAMMPMVYGPLYTRTYMATLKVLPGAVFLLGGAMTLPAVVIFGWFYLERQRDVRKENENLEK